MSNSMVIKSSFDIEESIKRNFPFDAFNPGQYDAIVVAINALRSGKKHILMELPTGIGKSAIATTIHRVMRDSQPSYRTTIVTATKGLQDQYITDDPEIDNLLGKANYSCPKGANVYGSAQCKTLLHSNGCDRETMCPYFKAREEWRFRSDLRLTNTAFAIKSPPDFIASLEDGTRSDLMVIDECHEIDEQLVKHATITISMDELDKHDKYFGVTVIGKFAEIINLFTDHSTGECLRADKDMIKVISEFVELLAAKIKSLKSEPAAGDSSDILSGLGSQLNDFILNNGEWIVDEFAFAKKLVLAPVYAHQVANRGLYEKSDQFIHMSATICGMNEYMKTMGIDEKTTCVITAPNPIPIEQRPILALNVMPVSKDFNVIKLAEFVDQIILRHPNQSGVIHTVSFKLAEDLKARSKNKKHMLISNKKDEILDFLKKPGSIILSPSIEAGYDFKGDLARWQIIAKVPYSFLGSAWVKLNMDRSNKWYARKAIVRIVQASGRAVRGITDHATTYILDSNFKRLYTSNQELFPDWYKDAVHMK